VSEDSTVEEVLEKKCGEPTTKTTETIDVYGHSDAGDGNTR
jgi:hypothetical protein